MERYPLSHPQKRIWFAENEHPDSGVNNIAVLQPCPEGASVGELEAAWHALVEKSDAFRLRLQEEAVGDDPFPASQYLVEDQKPEVELKVFETYEQAFQWAREVSGPPMPLYDTPLAKLWAVRVADRPVLHYCLLVHHIISDGWSVNLARDCLSASMNGEEFQATSYLHFLGREQDYLSSERAAADKAYWMEQARSYEDPLFLGSGKGMGKPFFETFTFDSELWALWKAFSEKQKVSPYKVMTAALVIYAARAGRLGAVPLGIANHNRSESSFFDACGMFVSTLPLMISYRPDESFLALLKRTKNSLNKMLKEHSRYPFDQLVSECRSELGLSFGQAVQVSLVGHPDRSEPLCFARPGVTPEGLALHFNLDGNSANGELTLAFSGDGVSYTLEDAKSIFHSLEAILRNALNTPDREVHQLSILSDDTWKSLRDFNGSFLPYPEDQSIPDLLQARWRENPHKISLVAGSEQISWEQLDHWSDQLAATLLERTDRASLQGSYVGVSLGRNATLIASILAVLKSGAAYVPLDPKYPESRLQYMVADAGIEVVFCRSQTAKLYEGTLTIDPDLVPRDGQKKLANVDIKPEQDAYVIYTSGTTGKPKGVPIQHHQVAHLGQSLAKPFRITADSTCLFFASTNFDASVAEIFVPLLQGARLVVASNKEREDGANLVALLRSHEVSWATIPPALLAVMPRVKLPHLLDLVVAGESTDPKVIETWSLGRNMINAYGPTENTVASTAGTFGADSSSHDIGPPIENVHCYVLDQGLRPVPVGVPGELFVAGPGVSRGYLNRPELNKERFLDNPYGDSTDKNLRMYKTGDLVRWLPSGRLEFIGRIDFQVKIRGHRIECGEVNNAVAQIVGVASSIVIPLPQGSTHRLVAYLLLDKESLLTADELRHQVAGRLPEYMIPSTFVILDEFPMTPNGKIDRRALPVPDFSAASETKYVAPKSDAETTLCQLIETVLGIEKVGVADDFFSLGGDSLSCMALVAKAKDAGVLLDVAGVKEHPTVRGMLANSQVEPDSLTPDFRTAEGTGKFPLCINGLMMARQAEHVMASGVEVPFGLVRWSLCGNMDEDRLVTAVTRVRDAHDVFRLRLEGEVLWPVDELPALELESIKESSLPDILKSWTQPDFNSTEPSCGFRLLKISEEKYCLALRCLHEVLDGWSTNLIEDEILSWYDSPEKDLTNIFQLRDFTEWYHSVLKTEPLLEAQKYWSEITKVGPVFEKPPQPADPDKPFQVVSTVLSLEPEVVRQFEARCTENGATLFEGAYAAYHLTLAKWSGRNKILSGYVTALRDTTIELQSVVGGLTNRLCLLTELGENTTFEEALKLTQSGLRENSRRALWPVWSDMDPQGHGFPHLFFHFASASQAKSGQVDGLELQKEPPLPLEHWPLGLAFQLLDSPEQPILLILGRAGYIDEPMCREMQQMYLDSLRGRC